MVDILHRVGINAKSEQVFAALSSIEGVRAWWYSAATGSAAQGERFEFGRNAMQVLAATPHSLVHWRCTQGPPEWLDTEVSFQLQWKQEQTFVLFKHAHWKEPVEFMHHCSTRWATFLLSLRDLLETGTGRPMPHDLKVYVGE